MSTHKIEMKSNAAVTTIACFVVMTLMNFFFLPELTDNSFTHIVNNICFAFVILYFMIIIFMGFKGKISFVKFIPTFCFFIIMVHWFMTGVNMFIALSIIIGTAVTFTFITMFVDGWWKFYKAEQAKWNKT